VILVVSLFFFSSRRRHTRSKRDWSSDVCSSDLGKFSRLQISQGFLGVVEIFIRRRGDTIFFHQILGERFGAFQDRRVFTRPEYRSEERRVGKEWRCPCGREHWQARRGVSRQVRR